MKYYRFACNACLYLFFVSDRKRLILPGRRPRALLTLESGPFAKLEYYSTPRRTAARVLAVIYDVAAVPKYTPGSSVTRPENAGDRPRIKTRPSTVERNPKRKKNARFIRIEQRYKRYGLKSRVHYRMRLVD